MYEVSVVVPCFNEAEVLQEFHQRLHRVLVALKVKWELLYIDDGSSDGTFSLLEGFCQSKDIRAIRFSRNFGKESAISAGLDKARGKAIIFLDADLQDPPELLPRMIARWQQGYDVVNMQRRCRGKESFFKRYSAKLFYSLIAKLNPRLHYPTEVSDFRLIGEEVVAALKSSKEYSRSFKSMVSWCGFRAIELSYDRDERYAGESKWNFGALIDLAIESIISVSRKPIRWFSCASALLFLCALGINLHSVFFGVYQIDVFNLLALSLIALGLSTIGEYLGAAYDEIKGRPTYLIATVLGDNYSTCGQSNSNTTTPRSSVSMPTSIGSSKVAL